MSSPAVPHNDASFLLLIVRESAKALCAAASLSQPIVSQQGFLPISSPFFVELSFHPNFLRFPEEDRAAPSHSVHAGGEGAVHFGGTFKMWCGVASSPPVVPLDEPSRHARRGYDASECTGRGCCHLSIIESLIQEACWRWRSHLRC
jgi:hypothetical protein